MNFLHGEYLLPVVVLTLLLITIFYKQESKFFEWVRLHWFYKRSKKNKIGSILYFIGFFLIALGLLDLRGPEKNINGKVIDQKTIILIDSSASMMAEDVRPSRFKKALLLAKHYVKKAVGQQVSIVVFSDSAKQIIPFTNDMDLVDARLGALEEMEMSRGGTSLTLAIKEAIQFFQNNSENLIGNILLFTDAEETDGGINLDLPPDISVGVIGVGTAKGAPIPIRDSRGVFKGNKKYDGKVVISKLDENFLKGLGNKIKDFRYWIATSYSLPTEDIINFFSRMHKIKQSKNNFRIKPVLSNYLIVPGVLFILMSFVLKNFNSFTLSIFLILSINISAQEPKEEEKIKSEEIIRLENKFKEGKISEIEKKSLASKLLQEGFSEESERLYNEIIDKKISKENLSEKFNLGSAQFKNKKIVEGFNTYKEMYDYLKKNDPENEMMEDVKANMLKALEQMGAASKSQKNKENQDDNNQDNQDQNGESGEQNKDQDQDNQNSENKKNNQNKSDKNKDGNDKEDQKNNDKDNKDKKNNDGKDKKESEKDKKKDENKDKNDGQPQGGKKKQLPAILKQLMSDDNQLQKKMIDTGTTKRKSREKKDW